VCGSWNLSSIVLIASKKYYGGTTMSYFLTNSGLKFHSYIPHTSSSISLENMEVVLNDIVLNSRSSIIEFGAGWSTLIIAKLLEINNISASFISVEENHKWMQHINSLLLKEGLAQRVALIHSPLVKNNHGFYDNYWYDEEILRQKIRTDTRFDSVLIDGPSAWEAGCELSRGFAAHFIQQRLMENFAIFLDDFDREGEKEIVKRWTQLFSWRFNEFNQSLAFYQQGAFFNVVP